jgi:copper chaperone NosL
VIDKGLTKFYAFLAKPIALRSRFVLALLVVPIAIAVSQPLWRIEMSAPQYPEGLSMTIYAHTIESGHDGRDLHEINILNHYIGMRHIDRQELTDLDWIPFALGLLAILTLRCAAIGTVSSLVDLVVITLYVAGFSMGRFVYRLYGYGHNLSADAPIKVPPFTPAILGTKEIANFTTTGTPELGTYLLALFGLGIALVLAWHLVVGRRQAKRELDVKEAAA